MSTRTYLIKSKRGEIPGDRPSFSAWHEEGLMNLFMDKLGINPSDDLGIIKIPRKVMEEALTTIEFSDSWAKSRIEDDVEWAKENHIATLRYDFG